MTSHRRLSLYIARRLLARMRSGTRISTDEALLSQALVAINVELFAQS